MSFIEDLNRKLRMIDVVLSDEQLNTLFLFYNEVVEKNKVMNLTAITEETDFIDKHLVDSLSSYGIIRRYSDDMFHVKHQSEQKEEADTFHVKHQNGQEEEGVMFHVKHSQSRKLRVIDIGTGAGFPGVPLAIAFPEAEFMLLDSLNKRTAFIEETCRKLGIKNVKTVHGRAEDMAHDRKFRERYDICVSRAVANLSTLSEYCLPFIHKDGIFIPYKSGNISEELNNSTKSIDILGGKITAEESFMLPKTDMQRTLPVIKKLRETQIKYPRKAGIPERKPL